MLWMMKEIEMREEAEQRAAEQQARARFVERPPDLREEIELEDGSKIMIEPCTRHHRYQVNQHGPMMVVEEDGTHRPVDRDHKCDLKVYAHTLPWVKSLTGMAGDEKRDGVFSFSEHDGHVCSIADRLLGGDIPVYEHYIVVADKLAGVLSRTGKIQYEVTERDPLGAGWRLKFTAPGSLPVRLEKWEYYGIYTEEDAYNRLYDFLKASLFIDDGPVMKFVGADPDILLTYEYPDNVHWATTVNEIV